MFRSLILFIALFAQALPVALMVRGEESAVCTMSCCATVAKAEDNACGCMKAPAEETAPAPVQTAPTAGRDLLAQPQWNEKTEPFAVSFADRGLSARQIRPRQDAESFTQPHVRLPVLFCSLLT